jgi:integrase
MRLTIKSTADSKLPAGITDTVLWDDDIAGFGLRLRRGGARTWIFRYRIGKNQFSIKLGNAKSVPLALARKNAGGLEARVRMGENPALDRHAAKIAADSTVGPLIDQYIDARKSEWRPASLRQAELHLLRYSKPLHKLPVGALSHRTVANLLADTAKSIKKSSGITTSNRLRGSLAAFLSWAIRQGHKLPEGNVASYTEARREKSRERVLTDAEIKTVWNACQNDDHGNIIKLLLLTGQREAEIGSLRWDEVQGDQILLSGERTKNKRPHIIPLSAPAAAILDRLRIVDRTLVFGRDDSHGFKGWGVSKKRLDQRIRANGDAPLPHWTVHDLRRTAATGMSGLGVQPHVVEAVLNHVSGHRAGVAGIYNRASYATEKREALNLWAAHVLAVVGANQ